MNLKVPISCNWVVDSVENQVEDGIVAVTKVAECIVPRSFLCGSLDSDRERMEF